MAIKVYERVPSSSPLKRNAQIQLATDLDAADRSDEAIKILKGVITEDPKDLDAIMALGNVERGRKKFSDCAQTYSQGIDVLPPAPAADKATGDKDKDKAAAPTSTTSITTTAASARNGPSSGRRRKPTCARRSSSSPRIRTS